MLTVSIVTFTKNPFLNNFHSKYQILYKSIEFISKSNLITEILIIDNSKNKYFSDLKNISSKIVYKHMNGLNLGYGSGHNLSRKFIRLKKYHLILNPDIIFYENNCLDYLYKYMENNPEVSLSQPLIFSYPKKEVQRLCKSNPTFLAQFIRLFLPKFLNKHNFLKKYNDSYEMRSVAYSNEIVESEYLSGCFMFCRVEHLNIVNWFDKRYFMYLEDADLTRMLSKVGKCVHIPLISIGHVWAKDSHTNFKLKIIAIYSFILYSLKWGLKIF